MFTPVPLFHLLARKINHAELGDRLVGKINPQRQNVCHAWLLLGGAEVATYGWRSVESHNFFNPSPQSAFRLHPAACVCSFQVVFDMRTSMGPDDKISMSREGSGEPVREKQTIYPLRLLL